MERPPSPSTLQIAIVFEFVGALLLGRVITSTIAGGIASIATFEKPPGPEIYAYGMIAALTMGFLWQWWASSKGLNVSATHSIIAGAKAGFGRDAAKGGRAPAMLLLLPLPLRWHLLRRSRRTRRWT